MSGDFPLWAISPEQQRGLLVVACVLCAASLAYAIYIVRKERDPWPLFVFAGAAMAVILEPVGDIFTKVVYPHVDQVSLFMAWGRKMPLWMGPNYAFFFCVPVLLIVRHLLQPGLTARKWWIGYLLLVIGCGAFEQPGIAAGSWKYYGSQSAVAINSYPIWIAFNNAQTLFSTAVGVFVLRSIGMRGASSVLLAFLVPMTIVGTHVAAALPAASVTNSSENQALIEVAAMATIALNVLLVWTGFKAFQFCNTR